MSLSEHVFVVNTQYCGQLLLRLSLYSLSCAHSVDQEKKLGKYLGPVTNRLHDQFCS